MYIGHVFFFHENSQPSFINYTLSREFLPNCTTIILSYRVIRVAVHFYNVRFYIIIAVLYSTAVTANNYNRGIHNDTVL